MTIAESLKQEGRMEGLQEGHEVGLQEGRAIGLQQGREEGREEGLQKGRLETQIETAKCLFEKGFSLDLIRSVTKLPDQALKDLFPNLWNASKP